MWFVLLLEGCFPPPPSTTTVGGIQVVAIAATPPEPDPFAVLTLQTWVADAYGDGADVLVWACTPVEGTCAEAWPPGSSGMPLPLWTHVGRAAPVDEVQVAWPFVASLAGDLLDVEVSHLVVWALACAPGVCPIIDAVQRDPVSGSDAWREVVSALGDPGKLVDGLPLAEASLAVKLVPLYGAAPVPLFESDTGMPVTSTPSGVPNRAPILLDQTPGDLSTDAGITELYAADPDGDRLSIRPFTTHGVIRADFDSDASIVSVFARPLAASPVPSQRFVVLDDGRGGTSVWTDAVTQAPCGPPGIRLTVPAREGDPVVFSSAFSTGYGYAAGGIFRVSGVLESLTPEVHLTVAIRALPSAVVLARSGTTLVSSGAACDVPFQFDVAERQEVDVCAFAGQVGEVVVTGTSANGTITTYTPTFVQIGDDSRCAL